MSHLSRYRLRVLSGAFALGALLFVGLAAEADAGEPARLASKTAASRSRTTGPTWTAPREEVTRTALQYAAIQGFTYTDRSTYVFLESGTLRLRIYPGSDVTVIAGREHRTKDRFVRSGDDVLLTARVQRFLDRQVAGFRAEESRRRSARAQRAPGYADLPPLPPRPVRAKRRPVLVRTKPVAEPRPHPRPIPGGDPAWEPAGRARAWKWIVVHHSDDLSGNMAKYDDFHRNVNHWENGCGYHFVIGNGSLSGDGEIEMGPRWAPQLQGAHAKVPGNRYNERGIGICLVGDFDEGGRRPTPAQMDSLVRLIRWLKGRYGVADADIHGHCDCCSTRCPGRHFPWQELRRRIR